MRRDFGSGIASFSEAADGSEPVRPDRVVAVRLIRGNLLVLTTILFALVACSGSAPSPTATTVAASTPRTVPTGPAGAAMSDKPTVAAEANMPAGARPRLAPDPVQLVDDLVADEQALRDPSTAEDALVAAARRQQAAYRAIGHHPEWDAVTRPRVP